MKYLSIYLIICLAFDIAVKDLQRSLSEYYEESFVDDMFCWHEEGHRISLSDIYVPIQWVRYDSNTAGTKQVALEEYHDVFRCKVSHSKKYQT